MDEKEKKEWLVANTIDWKGREAEKNDRYQEND